MVWFRGIRGWMRMTDKNDKFMMNICLSIDAIQRGSFDKFGVSCQWTKVLVFTARPTTKKPGSKPWSASPSTARKTSNSSTKNMSYNSHTST